MMRNFRSVICISFFSFLFVGCLSLPVLTEKRAMDYFSTEPQAVLFLRGNANQEILKQLLFRATQNRQGSDLIAQNSHQIFTCFTHSEEKGLVAETIVVGAFQPIHLNWVLSSHPLWQKKDSRIGWYQMKEGEIQIAAPFSSGIFLTTDSKRDFFNQIVDADIPHIENKKNDQLLEHDVTLQVRNVLFVDKLLTALNQSLSQPKQSVFMPETLFLQFFTIFSGQNRASSIASLSFSSLPLRSLEFFLDRADEDYIVGLSLEFRTAKEAFTSRALLLTMINRFLFQNGYQSTLVNKDIKASLFENVLTIKGLKIPQKTLLDKILGEFTPL